MMNIDGARCPSWLHVEVLDLDAIAELAETRSAISALMARLLPCVRTAIRQEHVGHCSVKSKGLGLSESILYSMVH